MSAPAAPPLEPAAPAPSSARRRRLAWLGRAAALLSIVLLLRHHFDLPFFFDEMWRVDYLTTPHLFEHYFRNDTGLPIGWVELNRALFAVLPDHEVAYRIVSLLWYLVFLELAWRFVRRSGSSPDMPPPAALVGAMALLVVAPGITEFAQSFNNYSFEMAYAAVLLVLVRANVATPGNERAALALLAPSPLLVLPAPFFAPWLYLDLWRRRRFVRPAAFAASAAAFLVSAASQYVLFMRPVVDEPLRSFFADQRVFLDLRRLRDLGARVLDLSAAATFRDSLVGDLLARAPRWAVLLLVAVLLLAGCAALFRLSRAALGYGAAALLLSAVASVVTGWPVGPNRVNASFWWVFLLATALAWCGAFGWIARIIRVPVTVGIAVAVLLAWPYAEFTRAPSRTGKFAQGLERDLRAIARSPVEGNLVVSYHFMSWWYPEYYLRARDRSGRDFKVVREVRGDDRLYTDLDGAVRTELGDRRAVWCILPYDNGNANDRACQLHLPGFRRFYDVKGVRAEVIGWIRDTP